LTRDSNLTKSSFKCLSLWFIYISFLMSHSLQQKNIQIWTSMVILIILLKKRGPHFLARGMLLTSFCVCQCVGIWPSVILRGCLKLIALLFLANRDCLGQHKCTRREYFQHLLHELCKIIRYQNEFSHKIKGNIRSPTCPQQASGAPKGSFWGISVRWGLNRLRYSDLIAVKSRDFFGETSPQTFVARGLINSCCFRKDKYVV